MRDQMLLRLRKYFFMPPEAETNEMLVISMVAEFQLKTALLATRSRT